jgi:hypothetical protein
MFRIVFFGAIRADDTQIRWLAAFGNLGGSDEEHGVGALDIFVALGEAANFFGVGIAPQAALAAFAKFSIFGDGAGIRIDRIAAKGHMVEEGDTVGDIVVDSVGDSIVEGH